MKIENSESFNLENQKQKQRLENTQFDRPSGATAVRISKLEIDKIADPKERVHLSDIKARNSSQDISIGENDRNKRKLLLG